MATKTIYELTAVGSLNETDVFVVDDGAHNYKISWNALKAMLGTVASFTADNTAGTITVTLANGTTLTITPHDPSKQNVLTFDNAPTANSNNPVKSGGVKAALDEKLDSEDYVRFTGATTDTAGTTGIVPAPAAGSPRYLSSEGAWMTPDSTPTENSAVLITSAAVYAALQALTLDAATKITGILPVSHGGSGLDASPSLLVNLASAVAANVMQASPRPGVTGVLPLANGGLGYDFSAAANIAAFHNSIYRGKSLGTTFTAAQSTAITSGLFTDMFIGDYWTINGVKYVIVDFDPYYRCGDNISLGHHIAVMPASNMVSAAWNVGSNDTSKMYIKSDIRIVTIQGLTSGSDPNVDSTAGVQGTIISAFGSSHVLKYRALYPSSQSSGKATGWAWTDARVELLNEVEVYGTQAWTAGGNGNGYEIGINKRQLSIFRLDPTFCNIRATWWLRSVLSAPSACLVNYDGPANNSGASYSFGVRPISLIA